MIATLQTVETLFSLFSPNHRDGVIHKTKADAETNEEHFDGVTTE